MDEVILVIKREDLFGVDDSLAFQGMLTDDEQVTALANNLEDSFTSMRRGDAENDPTFKQPIPYTVVRREDEVFVYKRLAAGGEQRLHDKYSIGVGGHMNPSESGVNMFGMALIENIERELGEELDIETETIEVSVSHLINDDSDDVGKVHLGILVFATVNADAKVSVKETDQLVGEWLKIEELRLPENFDKLENWSKIALHAIV